MNKSLNCFSDKALSDMLTSAESEYEHVQKSGIYTSPTTKPQLLRRIETMVSEIMRRAMVQA